MKSRITLAHLPPSVNAIWRHTKGGKTYRTKDYMTWLNGEGWNVKSQMKSQTTFTGPVYIVMAMRRPRANSDIDNRLKGVFDLLASVGIIANDKLVHGVNAYWSASLPSGVAAEITIVAADALEAA